MLNTDEHYKSKILQWDKFSSIRSRPRRIYCTADLDYCYPIERQPISTHAIVKSHGEDMVKKILLHTAYKFMFDIAYVEVELINNTALKIHNGTINYGFSDTLRHDMLSIIVDEAYHAYVAIDFINQIKVSTKITPFYETKQIELKYAIDKYMPMLPEKMQPIFEIIAICIGENTLTKELFNMTKQSYLNVYFHQVMADHMIDEGRHSNIFRYIMTEVWKYIEENDRLLVGRLLPDFIVDYLDNSIHVNFDIKLLQHLKFSDSDIETIIHDTHKKIKLEDLVAVNPVAANIIDVCERCGIFEHKLTFEVFEKKYLTTSKQL